MPSVDAGDSGDDVQGTAVPDDFSEASIIHHERTPQQDDQQNTGKRYD